MLLVVEAVLGDDRRSVDQGVSVDAVSTRCRRRTRKNRFGVRPTCPPKRRANRFGFGPRMDHGSLTVQGMNLTG